MEIIYKCDYCNREFIEYDDYLYKHRNCKQTKAFRFLRNNNKKINKILDNNKVLNMKQMNRINDICSGFKPTVNQIFKEND